MVSRRKLLTTGAALAAAAQARTANTQGPASKTLRVCFQTPETGFDPAQTQDYYSSQIINHIFDAPLRYDFLARPAKLIPNTAAALPEVSEDFRTFTIRLRPGIFFQDNAAFGGKQRELIAADYVYAIKRVFDPRWKSQVLFILEAAKITGVDRLRQRALKDKQPFDYATEIDGLRVLDRYTFRIRLDDPNPRFIYTLALANPLGAVAREVVEAYGDQIMAHPVGTGPFRLGHWVRTSRIVLERNPTYREEIYDFAAPVDAPYLTRDVERLRGRPARLSAMQDASRLLVAYMPYKFHLHRIQQDLAQPWLIGYRRHPFTTRTWAYLDIDNAYERPQA